jgi:hypothetical protein
MKMTGAVEELSVPLPVALLSVLSKDGSMRN